MIFVVLDVSLIMGLNIGETDNFFYINTEKQPLYLTSFVFVIFCVRAVGYRTPIPQYYRLVLKAYSITLISKRYNNSKTSTTFITMYFSSTFYTCYLFSNALTVYIIIIIIVFFILKS